MSKKSTVPTVTITGMVEYVNKSVKNSRGKWEPKSFTVRVVPEDPKQPLVLCICKDYCDPLPYDTIVATGVEEVVRGRRQLNLSHQPFLVPSNQREGIVKIIEKAMEKTYWDKPPHLRPRGGTSTIPIRAEQFFDSLRRDHDSDVEVMEWLDEQTESAKVIDHSMIGGDRYRFAKRWYEVSVMRRLYAIGITPQELRNYQDSKIQLHKDVLENPYKVVFLSIEKCNFITRLKGEKLDVKMMAAGTVLRHIYNRYTNNSHLFVRANELECHLGTDYSKCKELLYEEFDVVFEDASIIEGEADNPIEREDYVLRSPLCRSKVGLATECEPRPRDYNKDSEFINVYMNSNYQIELAISEYPIAMSRLPPLPELDIVFSRSDLSQDQMDGIIHASRHRLSILMGGAGTGKTTSINELYCNNKLNGRKTAIVAFTGRAAAVLRSKIEGCNASTVHRYLSTGEDPHHLIIDEASMLSTRLFYQLLVRFPSIEQVTLVGDDGQIVPVEPGAFFHHYVESGTIPTYRLTQNHRVKSGGDSGIIDNANRIARARNGRPVQLIEGKNFYIKDDEDGDITSILDRFLAYNKTIRRHQAQGKKVTGEPITTRMFTVICPLREQVMNLNKVIQSKFRSGEYMYIGKGPMKVFVEDRVMMLVNDYDVGVFNGEEGYVTELHPEEGYIVVDFTQPGGQRKLINVVDDSDLEPWEQTTTRIGNPRSDSSPGSEYHGELREYNKLDKKESDTIRASAIEHSYANTPHKYQGSESDYVIVVLPNRDKPNSFMSRNLLYTAITRARISLTVVGSRSLINRMASYWPKYGNDNTCHRLHMALPYLPEQRLPYNSSEEEDYDEDWDDEDYEPYFSD